MSKSQNICRRMQNDLSGSKSTPSSNSADPILGIVKSFRPGEYERVEKALADLKVLGITDLRTAVSWADWCTPEGGKWYTWLLPRLAKEVNILPYFIYTPPSLGLVPKTSAPPRNPKWYADFIDQMITLFGEHFEWVELWSEPNNLREWDVDLDPEWWIFSEMIGGAAYWAKHRGKKTVLGSTGLGNTHWVRLMCERRVMQYVDAVGLNSFPMTSESQRGEWTTNVAKVREVLDRHGSEARVWITRTGYSTWRHDERRQLSAFVKAVEAPVERVYWYSLYDIDPGISSPNELPLDERDYHFGLKHSDGTPKLLFRLWENGGLGAVRNTAWWGEPKRHRSKKRPVLITGGAGFIGTNVAHRLLSSGGSVLLFDNLSRPGVERNLQWLRDRHGDLLQVEIGDIRDSYAINNAVKRASQVFHFAAQVAVTTSLTVPVDDFEINTRGTLNLLEALRAHKNPPPLVFASTNKVYGGLEGVCLVDGGTRYEPEDPMIRMNGIGENRPLDFHSPYGCSKGAADQYVIDYARTYDVPAVVFRMSCIYGPHQFGTEDQGWVAHFVISAIENQPITLYGDGKQVRDILFVDDLVDAFLLAQENIDAVAGRAFNMGGGPSNTTSLLELVDLIHELHGKRPTTYFAKWRPGDQRYYVSDTRKFKGALGWSPKVKVSKGVRKLYQWLCSTRAGASAYFRSVEGMR